MTWLLVGCASRTNRTTTVRGAHPTVLLCAVSLRLPLKTRMGEVLVECQRGLEFHTSHLRKGNAVGEGKLFVVVLLEPLEPCREVFHTDVQEIDRGAGTQATRDGHSTSVIQTSTDESERFIENVGSNNERLRALLKQPPERDRWFVMLIVCVFQRQYETGVEQDGRQVSRSYRYSSWRAKWSATPLWSGLEPSSKTGSSAAGMGNMMMRPGSGTISTCFAPLSRRLGISTPSFFRLLSWRVSERSLYSG